MGDVTQIRNAGPGGVRGRLVAVWRGVVLYPEMFPVLLTFTCASIALSFLGLGVGIFLLPSAILPMRRLAECRRRRIGIPSPHRPEPGFPEGVIGRVQRCVWLPTDRPGGICCGRSSTRWSARSWRSSRSA